jgi:Xaa-Pro dipeptidase
MNINFLLNKMHENNIEVSIFLKNENIKYITGFYPTSFGLVILKENPILLVSKMDKFEAEKKSNIPVEIFNGYKHVQKILNKIMPTEIHLEESTPIGICKKLNGSWKLNISNFIENLRMEKENDEISDIIKSARIAESAVKNLDYIGNTELDVMAQINYNMHKAGSWKEAFDTIVASGVNSSLPHSIPSEKVINDEVMLIDWGATYNNYCSDMTRTRVESEKEEEIRDIVIEAKNAGINSISDGVHIADIDKIVRDIISEYGYGDNFIHTTGHGVGLEIHENPNIYFEHEGILKKNMVVTVEPGIYLENGFGVRVEDMVLVKKNNAKVLTKLPEKFNFD